MIYINSLILPLEILQNVLVTTFSGPLPVVQGVRAPHRLEHHSKSAIGSVQEQVWASPVLQSWSVHGAPAWRRWSAAQVPGASMAESQGGRAEGREEAGCKN